MSVSSFNFSASSCNQEQCSCLRFSLYLYCFFVRIKKHLIFNPLIKRSACFLTVPNGPKIAVKSSNDPIISEAAVSFSESFSKTANSFFTIPKNIFSCFSASFAASLYSRCFRMRLVPKALGGRKPVLRQTLYCSQEQFFRLSVICSVFAYVMRCLFATGNIQTNSRAD